MFHAPSPKGTNNAQLFLTKAGVLVDRHGRNWGRSQILAMDALPPDLKRKRKLTYDDVSATNMSSSGEPKKPMNWHASAARNDLNAALEKLCKVMNWEHEDVAGQIGDILDEAEREQVQEHAASLGVGRGKGAGAGALDDADVDEDEVEERVREFLSSKGLDDQTISEALKRVKADRAAAKDRIPKNGMHGTGGHTSRGPSGSRADSDADMEAAYPGISNVMRDTLGELDPNRNAPGYHSEVYRAGLAAAAELPGGGVSRRLSNDAAAIASDADLAKEYPGIENVGTTMWR